MRAAHGLGLSFLLACSSPQRPELAPKVVEAPPPASSAANTAEASRPVPAWLAEALTWQSLTLEPVRSSHLASPELAEIRVNPEARAAYLALVADSELPSGTRIVQVHRDPATGRRGPIFALVRAAAGWEFFVFDGSGRPLGAAAPAQCASCHAGAPAAPIFGLARDRELRPQELNSASPRSTR